MAPTATAAALALLVALSVAPGLAKGIPSRDACGMVGASSTPPAIPRIPPPDPPAAEVVVTTVRDVVDGDVASVVRLRADAGPDGISLREAILATNAEAEGHAIRFAPALAGAVIEISPESGPLPAISGPPRHLTGDADGDGAADVTLRNAGPARHPQGFTGVTVATSAVAIEHLVVEGFSDGIRVVVERAVTGTYLGNLALRGADNGIVADFSSAATGPLDWRDATVQDSLIDVVRHGLAVWTSKPPVAIDGFRFLNNTVEHDGAGGAGIAFGIGFGPGGDGSVATDLRIEGNRITVRGWRDDVEPGDAPIAGVKVSAGEVGASRNRIENVTIRGNRVALELTNVRAPADGVFLTVGDAASDWGYPDHRPVAYPTENRITRVDVSDNHVTGYNRVAVWAMAGWGGAVENEIAGLSVVGNVAEPHASGKAAPESIRILGGSGVEAGRPGSTRDNRIVDLAIRGNTLAGPITVLAAEPFRSHDNRVERFRIENNRVDAPGLVGIRIVGGEGATTGNVVADGRIACNELLHAPDEALTFAGARGISLIGGRAMPLPGEDGGPRGNVVRGVVVEGNVVAGGGGAAGVFADVGEGAEGNDVRDVTLDGERVDGAPPPSRGEGPGVQSPPSPGSRSLDLPGPALAWVLAALGGGCGLRGQRARDPVGKGRPGR